MLKDILRSNFQLLKMRKRTPSNISSLVKRKSGSLELTRKLSRLTLRRSRASMLEHGELESDLEMTSMA